MTFLRIAALAVVAAVAAAPAAAPERGQVLAYEAPDGVHLIAADGSGDRLLRGSEPGDQNPRRVTRGWGPRFSPDGRLTFQLEGRLLTTDADGHDRREFPRRNGRSWAPSWSSDGSRLALYHQRALHLGAARDERQPDLRDRPHEC